TDAAAREKLAFVLDLCPNPRRLLDVGASYGHFLAAAQSVTDAYGLELNASAVKWSVDRFAVRNEVASLFEIPQTLPAAFDAVTAWDVIEHIENPRTAIALLRERLRPGGWLFVSTPDAGSLSAHALGRRWYYQDPVQHINLFSRRNLERVLRESGFAPMRTRYFGRQYRLRYVINRLRYLAGNGLTGRALAPLGLLPRALTNLHIRIKMWDVMGIAAQRQQ